MEGRAASRIFLWMEFCRKTGTPLTLSAFFDQLDSTFVDSQKVKKAIDKLTDISQGDQAFRNYHYEFE